MTDYLKGPLTVFSYSLSLALLLIAVSISHALVTRGSITVVYSSVPYAQVQASDTEMLASSTVYEIPIVGSYTIKVRTSSGGAGVGYSSGGSMSQMRVMQRQD